MDCINLAKLSMAPYYEESGIEWKNDERLSAYQKCELFEVVGEIPFGFLLLRINASELYIGDLQVTPEHQRKGVGTYAIQRAIEFAKSRGFGKVKLKVFKSNPAKNLYIRCGFSIVAEELHILEMELDTNPASWT